MWLIPQGALAAQKENDEVDHTVELANARKFQANFTQTLVASSARCFEQVDIFKILLYAWLFMRSALDFSLNEIIINGKYENYFLLAHQY